ncbi:MAG: hypothetical protein QXV32_03675 [Conexivisphaerales archaeon]
MTLQQGPNSGIDHITDEDILSNYEARSNLLGFEDLISKDNWRRMVNFRAEVMKSILLDSIKPTPCKNIAILLNKLSVMPIIFARGNPETIVNCTSTSRHLLNLLTKISQLENIKNFHPIIADSQQLSLPEDSLDVAFLDESYLSTLSSKNCQKLTQTLTDLRTAMRPDGQFILAASKLTKHCVLELLKSNEGFLLLRTYKIYPNLDNPRVITDDYSEYESIQFRSAGQIERLAKRLLWVMKKEEPSHYLVLKAR